MGDAFRLDVERGAIAITGRSATIIPFPVQARMDQTEPYSFRSVGAQAVSGSQADHDAWVAKARAIPIEVEPTRRGLRLNRQGHEFIGPCPICREGHDRFSINPQKQLWNCRQCNTGGRDALSLVAFLDGLDLTVAKDFRFACQTLIGEPDPHEGVKPRRAKSGKPDIVATFDYEDENGKLSYQRQRVEFIGDDGQRIMKDGKPDKQFWQRRPDPNKPGKFITNIDGVRLLPYRLPELIEDLAHERTAFIVEGERKVDLLRRWNTPATCGAKEWPPYLSEHFKDSDLVILPDNDKPGKDYANRVAASLAGVGCRVRTLELPGLGPKEDVINWAARGGTVEALHDLIEHEARPWTPSNGRDPESEVFLREDEGEPRLVRKFKGGAAFIREYEPISYSIGGILPSGSGKTAFFLLCLFAVAFGRPEILGVAEVELGHVAYIALENPTDIRMKMAVYAYVFGISSEELESRITVIDSRLNPKEIFQQLTLATDEKGPLQVVFYDTFQAGYKGGEFNDNAGILKYAQELRTLATLPGKPTVFVAAHPTKRAAENDLEPYGGGAVGNEMDGNLTLWKDDKGIRLHWTKLRGPIFEPRYFRIEMLSTPDIVDNKGRQILLPVCYPMSEEAAEQRQEAKNATDADALKSFAEDPKASERERASRLGIRQSSLQYHQRALVKEGFLEKTVDGKHRLTKKGRREMLHIVPEGSPDAP